MCLLVIFVLCRQLRCVLNFRISDLKKKTMLLRKVSQSSALCGTILRVPPVLSRYVKLAYVWLQMLTYRLLLTKTKISPFICCLSQMSASCRGCDCCAKRPSVRKSSCSGMILTYVITHIPIQLSLFKKICLLYAVVLRYFRVCCPCLASCSVWVT